MIFRDQAHQFRDTRSGEVVLEPEWTGWDYALVTALQLIEDYSTPQGIPIWEVDESAENVLVEAVRKIDRFEAAKSRTTSRKNYKARAGEVFTPRVTLRWGEWPTWESWVERQSDSAPEGDSDIDEMVD